MLDLPTYAASSSRQRLFACCEHYELCLSCCMASADSDAKVLRAPARTIGCMYSRAITQSYGVPDTRGCCCIATGSVRCRYDGCVRCVRASVSHQFALAVERQYLSSGPEQSTKVLLRVVRLRERPRDVPYDAIRSVDTRVYYTILLSSREWEAEEIRMYYNIGSATSE